MASRGTKLSERLGYFAAGAAAGALLVLLTARLRRGSNGGGAKRKGSHSASSPSTPSVTMRKTPSGTPLMPYQHEAKMQARLNSTGGPEEPRGMLTSASAMDLIHEEVIDEHAQERQKVTVRVPATSANMGPGYDCLGMALNIWSEVTVERSDRFEIVYEGEGEARVPRDESNLLVTGVKAAFQAAGKEMPLLRYHCVNRIPYARGMGSSSAAIVAGIIAGLVLAGHRLPCWGHEALLQLACGIEGHPDNVAPVIYGGCQLGIHNGERWQTERVQLPSGIQVVLFIPDFEGKTSDARGVLKDTVTREEAIFSVGRVAWLVNALSTGNLDNLRSGCQDALHQPQRAAAVYKYLDPVVNAAIEAGACAAYLSGAGPTVAAITSGASGDIFTQRAAERVDKEVATAMVRRAREVGVTGRVYITQPIETGAVVVSASPEFSQGCIRYEGEV